MRNRRQGQRLGGETIMVCRVSASPLAMSLWQRAGRAVTAAAGRYDLDAFDDGPNAVILNLRIAHVARHDYGAYQCVAQNGLGRDTASMELVGKWGTGEGRGAGGGEGGEGGRGGEGELRRLRVRGAERAGARHGGHGAGG